MTLSTLSGKPLLKADRPAFKKRMAEIIAEKSQADLAIIPVPEQVADEQVAEQVAAAVIDEATVTEQDAQ